MRGMLPDSTNNNNPNSDTNILSTATEVLHTKILPLIMSAREEFYVINKDFAVTANQANYVIPTRSSAMLLREVQLTKGDRVHNLPIIPPEGQTNTSAGEPIGYFLQHNDIMLYPTPSTTTGTLKVRYFIRPNTLAKVADCTQITAVGATTLTFASIPSTWSTTDTFDFISKDSPHEQHAIDQVSSSVLTTTMEFASIPDSVVVGDWVSLSDTTPIPQLPIEFMALLAIGTAEIVLWSLGDREGAATLKGEYREVAQGLLGMITPRNQGEVEVINNIEWSQGTYNDIGY